MGGARVTRAATMKLLLAVLVLSLRGIVARAQSDNICTVATNDPTHCKCETPDGSVIDVTSLGDPNKNAKYTITDDNGNSYDFNPCYGLSASACTDGVVPVSCQTAGDGVGYDCGSITTGEFHYDSGQSSAYLTYTGGQDDRQTTVNLACDESRDDPTVEAFGDTQTTLTYVFTITHKCACPGVCGDSGPGDGGGGGGGGDISGPIGLSLIILSIAAFGMYFIIGAIVLKFKFQKTGADIVPQKEFWISFPSLLKGGFMFTFGPVIKLVRKDKAGYEEL